MKYHRIILLWVSFVLIVSSVLDAAYFFTARGSVQLGGSFSFKSTGYEDDRYRFNEFYLSPEINFFPIDFLLVGPSFKIDIKKMYADNRSIDENSWFGIGGKIGFAYGREIPVIPYVYGSPQIIIDSNEDDSDPGFGMELNGGIIVPVQKHFSINFGTGFWFQVIDKYLSHQFFCSVGITGLIF